MLYAVWVEAEDARTSHHSSYNGTDPPALQGSLPSYRPAQRLNVSSLSFLQPFPYFPHTARRTTQLVLFTKIWDDNLRSLFPCLDLRVKITSVYGVFRRSQINFSELMETASSEEQAEDDALLHQLLIVDGFCRSPLSNMAANDAGIPHRFWEFTAWPLQPLHPLESGTDFLGSAEVTIEEKREEERHS